MFPFSTPFAMWSPLRVELVEQRLEEVVSPRWQLFGLKPLSGRVDSRRVVVYATPRGRRNGPARMLDVRLIPDDGGTRLEGRFRLRWGDAIFSVIVLMVMSVVFGDQLVESLSSTSSRWRGSSFFPVLYLVMVFCIFLVPILSRSDDERLTAGLERLLASERPKELDCDTGA